MEAPSLLELSKKAYLTPAYASQVKQRVKDAEETLKQRDFLSRMPGVDVDVDAVSKFLEKDKRTLELGTPEEYPGYVKNKLLKQMRDLEEKMKFDMPTLDEMEKPTAVNIDKHMAWEKAHKSKVLAWRAIRRILAPDNDSPNFTNMETMRSNTPPKGDPRKYFIGFDNIKFETAVEEEVGADISDADYLTFLELKVLQWAQATICKELNWSNAQHAAALERFRRSHHATDADAARLQAEPSPAEDVEADNSAEKFAAMMRERNIPPIGKKQPRPPKRMKFTESHIWPAPQMRESGISLADMGKLSGIHHVRISAVCAGTGSFRPEEKASLELALADYKQAHAFVGEQPVVVNDDTV